MPGVALHELEQLHRRRVRPLQVVDEEHHRRVGGEAARAAGAPRRTRGTRRRSIASCWSASISRSSASCPAPLARLHPSGPTADRSARSSWTQGHSPGVPAPSQHTPVAVAGAATLGFGQRLGGQAGLADAGLAGDQHEPSHARAGLVQRPEQLPQRQVTADQRGPEATSTASHVATRGALAAARSDLAPSG